MVFPEKILMNQAEIQAQEAWFSFRSNQV